MPMRAAALTYTFILGVVPAIAVCLSIFSFFVDIKQKQSQLRTFILQSLTTGTGNILIKHLDEVIQNVRFRTIGYVGFIALLFASLMLLSSVEASINQIWRIRSKKKLWKRVFVYNMILVFGPICLSLSILASTVVNQFSPALLAQAHFSALAINAVFLTLIYKILPDTKVNLFASIIAAITATLAGELARHAFTSYTAKAMLYNQLYGSLAALPFFLIWIYLSWMIFLGGVLLNYMIQNRNQFKLKGAFP